MSVCKALAESYANIPLAPIPSPSPIHANLCNPLIKKKSIVHGLRRLARRGWLVIHYAQRFEERETFVKNTMLYRKTHGALV